MNEPFDVSELNLPKVRTGASVFDVSGLDLEKTEEEKQRQRDASFLNQGVDQDTRIKALEIQQIQREDLGIAVPADVIEEDMARYSQTREEPFPVNPLDSPVTARRLEDKDAMPVYKGSEQQTVDTEGYFKSIADRWRLGKISDSLGRLGYKQLYGTSTPEEDALVKFYEDQVKKLQPLTSRINNNTLMQEVGNWFADIPGTVAEMTPAILSAVANSKEEALIGASAGALGMTPFSVGAGFAAGVSAGTIADVGLQEAGHAYLEFSKMTDDTGKKFNPLVVKGAAILTGTINGVLEFAGEKFFAGLLGKGFSGFSKKTIKQMLNTRSGRQLFMKVGAAVGAGAMMNGGEEALQQATNVVMAETIRVTHGAKPKGFKEDAREVLSAFSGGVKGGMGMSFGMEVGPMIVTEKLINRDINRNADMVKALSGVTADSAILEKVPERYRQDVREIIAEHGAAPTIGMKHQSFSLFLEDIGITEEQLQKEMPQVYESLMDARMSQRDVKIPTADFIEYFSQNTEIQQYYGDVRMHPGIPTDNETKAQLAKFDQMIGATIPSAENAEIHKQFADLLGQVEDPQVADYQARVLTSFFTRMKEESPELTIEEFMEDFSIDAVRQDLDNEAQANLVAKIQSDQLATDEQIYGKSLQEFMTEEGSTPESAVAAGYFATAEISQDEFNLAMESPDPVYVYGGENTKLLTERKQAEDLQARAKERGVDVMQGTPEEVVQGMRDNPLFQKVSDTVGSDTVSGSPGSLIVSPSSQESSRISDINGEVNRAVTEGIISEEHGNIIRAVYSTFPENWQQHLGVSFSGKEGKYDVSREKIGDLKEDARHIINMYKGGGVEDFFTGFGDFAFMRLLDRKQSSAVKAAYQKDRKAGKAKGLERNEWFAREFNSWFKKMLDGKYPRASTEMNSIFKKMLSAVKKAWKALNRKTPLDEIFTDIIVEGRDLNDKYYYSDKETVLRYVLGSSADRNTVNKQGFSGNSKTLVSWDPGSICPKQRSLVDFALKMAFGESVENVKEIPADSEAWEVLSDPDFWIQAYTMAKAEEDAGRMKPGSVPCSYCYVEQARTKAMSFHDKGKPISGVNFAMAKMVYENSGYKDDLLNLRKWPQSKIDEMNLRGGLRLFSFSDYVRDMHKEDVTRLLTHASERGLSVKAITKNVDFLEDFASTGIVINLSIDDGVLGQNGGVAWDVAAKMKAKYPNVKIRVVALNRQQYTEYADLSWKGIDKFIDVITPYHHDDPNLPLPEGFDDMTIGKKGGNELVAYIESERPELKERTCCLVGGKCFGVKHQEQCATNCGALAGNLNIPDMTASKKGPLFQSQEEPRGYIDIGDKNYYKITLTGKANLTTFLHESGHMFLDVMNKMSQKKSASSGLKKDMATLYSWLGVEEGQTSFTVEQQEQFAEGFEQYLMEGNAPSLELKSAFARFKQWFTDVYKNTKISELLNDDVRAVMDRMLATDTAIRSAATAASMAPMFPTAEMAGMTEAGFNEYLESFSDAIEDSEEKMRVKIMKEVLRRRTAEYKEKKKELTGTVGAEVASRQVYQALLYLTTGTLNHDGIPPDYLSKLDQKKVNELLKANPELKGNLPRGISKKKGGADPDVVAMYFGYKSGHEMMTDMAGVKPYKKTVQEEVQGRLDAIYGDSLKDSSALANEANRALHGDKHGKFLVRELRALSSKNNKPLPPGFYALARSTAKSRVSRMTVGELSSAYHFQQAEQRAGKLAIEAAVKNDWKAAAEYKAQQIMNYMMYRSAVKAKEEIDKTQRYLKSVQDIKKQKKLGLAGGEYLESINAMLEGVDLRQKSGAAVNRRKLLSEYLAQMESNGQVVTIPDYLRIEAFLRHYSEFTSEEFFALRDAIKNIDRLATLKLKLITERGMIDKKAAIKKIVDSIAENVKPKKARKAQDMTAWEKLKSTIRSGDADLLKVEFLFEQLDGGDIGVMHEALFQPIADAQKEFYDRMEKLGKTMLKPFRDIPRDQQKRLGASYDVMGIRMTGFNVMALALNMGNDGNFQKLIDGYNKSENRGYNRENLMEAVGNILTKEDLDVVQHIWDEVNQFWPEIEALQKDNTGIAPPKVEAVPLILKHGTLRGGYYPVIYDRTRDFKQNENELAKGYSNDIFESNLMRKGVSKGFTEARTTYVGPIDLNVQAIGSHLNEVVFFLTHYQAIDNVNQLISSPDIRDAMANTVGVEYHTMLKEWIHSVANDAKISDTELWVSKFANHMMVGTSIVAMGGNLSTAFTQILGLTSAVARIGLPAVMKGMTMATNPKNWKAAYSESKELAHMMTTFDRDARKHLSKMMLEMGGGKWENVKYKHGQIVSAAFWTIGAMQQYVNVSVYLGAYNEGMKDKNMSENQASRYADSIMRKTQSAAGAKDMARIQRDRAFGKLFTAFYSYFSSLYGLMRETGKNFSSDGVMKSMGKVMALVIIPVLLDKIMRKGVPDDEDEWKKFKGDVVKDFFLYPMASIPLARDIVSGVYGDYGYSFAPVGAGLRKLTLGVKGMLDPDKDMSRANVRNLIDSFGMVTHLPTKPITKTDKFIEAYMNGEIEEPIQEFIFGVKR